MNEKQEESTVLLEVAGYTRLMTKFTFQGVFFFFKEYYSDFDYVASC